MFLNVASNIERDIVASIYQKATRMVKYKRNLGCDDEKVNDPDRHSFGQSQQWKNQSNKENL